MAYMKEANHIYGSVTGCHVNNILFVFVYLFSCGQEIIQYKMLQKKQTDFAKKTFYRLMENN